MTIYRGFQWCVQGVNLTASVLSNCKWTCVTTSLNTAFKKEFSVGLIHKIGTGFSKAADNRSIAFKEIPEEA